MEPKSILVMAAIGILAGFLASLFVGGATGVLGYLIAGILGSFVGGFVFDKLGINLNLSSPLISQVVTSTIGAIIIIVLARLIL